MEWKKRITFALAVMVSLAFVGCSSGGESLPDGSVEDARDGAGDGDVSAADDGGFDAADGGADAADGGADAADGLDGDDQGPGPWDNCPPSTDYVGGDWPWTLRVVEGAIYCASFNEARTLEQEKRLKGRIRLTPGDYPVPDQNGEYEFRLPVCLEVPNEDGRPELAEPGTLNVNHSEWNDGIQFRVQLYQPLKTAGGQEWTLYLSAGVWIPKDQTVIDVLDGSYQDPYNVFIDIVLCHEKEQCWLIDDYSFASCGFETARPQIHSLGFERGNIDLHFMMGDSMASTEPGAFVRAKGVLDGQVFDQQEYYKLVYNPEHHHFRRDYAVIFDEPIGDACGLKAINLVPWEPEGEEALYTIDCELGEIEQITIESIEFDSGF